MGKGEGDTFWGKGTSADEKKEKAFKHLRYFGGDTSYPTSSRLYHISESTYFFQVYNSGQIISKRKTLKDALPYLEKIKNVGKPPASTSVMS